jgi:DNA repair exonuclease SbcCD ATPase subunit
MAAEYDSTEFVDPDFQTSKSPFATGAPTRDDVDRKVVEAQQKLAELKRAQDSLERERASLEELRRRQSEFQTGRQEMIQNLTRGIGLLEEVEFNTRREAEQMAKTIADFRDALAKIEAVRDEIWTKENFHIELTRALTAIENARMEWNTARLKLPALSPEALKKNEVEVAPQQIAPSPLANLSFGALCKIGLAMTWPLVLVALGALGIFIAILLRH